MYYTYVLQSGKDDKFYVGFTKDLKLRFEKHSKGQVKSTRDRQPLKLIYYEACLSQDDATKKEAQILFNRVNKKQLLAYDLNSQWHIKGCKQLIKP